MHVDIPYTSIMTSFIFFEKLESAFGPAVPNTPSPASGSHFDPLNPPFGDNDGLRWTVPSTRRHVQPNDEPVCDH